MVFRAEPLLRLAGLVCLASVAPACSGLKIGGQGVGTHPNYALPNAPGQDRVGFELGQAAMRADSPTALVHQAIDAVARGESLYLATQDSVNLLGFKSWYAVFGNSLQERLRLAEGFLQPDWGTVLWHTQSNGVHEYYFHIKQWPRTPQLILPYELRGVQSAALLGHQSGEYPLAWQHIAAGTQFFLPKRKPHPTANVVRVLCEETPIAPQAAAVLPESSQTGGLFVAGWPGEFDSTPQPDFLADAARDFGIHPFSLSAVDRQTANCLRWEGYLHIARTGRYEVQLLAESGAVLSLGETGTHRSDSLLPLAVHLEEGWHPVNLVWHGQSGQEGVLSLRYRTRGGRFHEWAAQQLATHVFDSE